jgi:nucleotide-binding universal stress UspA family protein
MMSANYSTTQETTHVQGAITPFCKILVPLDGAPLAEEALPVALAFAKRAGSEAKLVLLHASRVEVSVFAGGGGSEVPSVAQPKAEYLGGIAQRVKDEGVEIRVNAS